MAYRAALFERASAQGHAGAFERLGAFAESGRGGAKDAGVAKTYYEKAVALGNEDAKVALKRLECPYVMKDKRGKFVTNLCFLKTLPKNGKGSYPMRATSRALCLAAAAFLFLLPHPCPQARSSIRARTST